MEEELKTGRQESAPGAPDLAGVLASCMHLPKKDWMQYPPLALAWIGDTVYDLIVRSILLQKGMTQPDRLHQKASREDLTQEEQSVYRRGRNAKPAHKAKNADMEDYLEATAFECLVGYLYLNGRYERLMELVGPGMDMQQA